MTTQTLRNKDIWNSESVQSCQKKRTLKLYIIPPAAGVAYEQWSNIKNTNWPKRCKTLFCYSEVSTYPFFLLFSMSKSAFLMYKTKRFVMEIFRMQLFLPEKLSRTMIPFLLIMKWTEYWRKLKLMNSKLISIFISMIHE